MNGIKVDQVAHPRFQVPDLGKMRGFFADLGFGGTRT